MMVAEAACAPQMPAGAAQQRRRTVVLLMRHLDGDFNIYAAVQAISTARCRGRPKKATPALQVQPEESPGPPASFYVGVRFAKFFPSLSSVAYRGKVVDTRRVTGQNIAANILFKVHYPAQLGSEAASSEEVLHEELLAGIKLHRQLLDPVSAIQAAQ
jgi:hypothetical protein